MGILDTATSVLGQMGLNKLGDALGISSEARKWEYEQKKMQEEYRLNEMAAENAFNRENQMNDKTYAQNSFGAKTRQMEDAGLSIGLMYGGGGASGGGAGSTSSQPQGGVSLPQSSGNDPAGDPLTLSTMKVNESIAKKNEAEAKKADEEAKTEENKRDTEIEKMRQEGIAQWLQNCMTEYLYKYDLIEGKEEAWKNEKLQDEAEFNPNSSKGRTEIAKVLDAEASPIEKIEGANRDIAEAALANEKTKWVYIEMVAALLQGQAAKAIARAKELEQRAQQEEMEFRTGQKTNWKTWYNVGTETGRLLIDGASLVMKGGVAKSIMEQANEHWEKEMEQRMNEEEGRNRRQKNSEVKDEYNEKGRRTKRTITSKM